MCIRDSDLTDEEADALLAKVDEITAEKKAKEEEERKTAEPVSYTHLDVYKRQPPS